ncbi:LTA synthase family protein [Paenibacillus sp. DMB20]|uniref:LTA synthase family protein n=1 Tax=Paenibacillus sp. DMB20 TaxID=1642570 RepID=UPI00228676E8|nr:sulfatase-like hydrolase/transferase [Paenibacillus sp. DMB20]
MPKREQQLDTGSFRDTMFGDYLQSVHYVDKALGQFVGQMKAQGLWDNSILVIYGDHDNSIKEAAYYEQFLGRPVTALDMEQIMNQVPLLIHLPDGALAGIDSNPSGMMDTAPTIYHLLGIPSESYDLMGQSLTVNKDRLVPLRSGAFSDNRSFYIPSETGRFESGTCYSLSTREPVGVNACRQGYEESQTMFRFSDQIITYDLIKSFNRTDHANK